MAGEDGATNQVAKADAINADELAVLIEPAGFARPQYAYESWGSKRQHEKLVRKLDEMIKAVLAGDDEKVAKIQEEAAAILKPFWSCLKIKLQDADWLRERSAYLPLVVAMHKNPFQSSKDSARIALTEALTHEKTTNKEIAKVCLAFKLGRMLFGSWVPPGLAAAGLEGVKRNAAETAAMDEGVKELPRGVLDDLSAKKKRKAQDEAAQEACKHLALKRQKAEERRQARIAALRGGAAVEEPLTEESAPEAEAAPAAAPAAALAASEVRVRLGLG